DVIQPPPSREPRGIAVKEVRMGRSGAGGVFPLRLRGQAVLLPGHYRQPLAILLRRVVGHGDGGPRAASPSLVRRAIGWGGARYGVGGSRVCAVAGGRTEER